MLMQVFRNPGHIFQDIVSRLAQSMGRVRSGLSPCKVRVLDALFFIYRRLHLDLFYIYMHNTRSSAAILAARLRRAKDKSRMYSDYQTILSKFQNWPVGYWKLVMPHAAILPETLRRSSQCLITNLYN